MNQKNQNKELNEFQLRNIKILTHLLTHNAINDEIVEYLRKSELDYFSLIDKFELLEHKINIDEKTNLLKYKNDYLTNILKTASRIYFGMENSEYSISLVRFDIDNFSIFNNKYGHGLGDRVLKKIADLLRSNSRPTDYAIRFGGEEFDVLLPATNIEGTRIFLENIFREIRKAEINYKNQKLKVTVSAGISTLTYSFSNKKKIDDDETENYFILLQQEADDALYEAKNCGKDRYCIYDKSKKDDYAVFRDSYCSK
jgi:two-component system, cell cycle response regulator